NLCILQQFGSPMYRGHGFLRLKDNAGKFMVPSYLSGGTWLKHLDNPRICARVVRGLLNHAPIGSYRIRFNLEGSHDCDCGRAVESREHILNRCPTYTARNWELGRPPEFFDDFVDFCREEETAFSFRKPSGTLH